MCVCVCVCVCVRACTCWRDRKAEQPDTQLDQLLNRIFPRTGGKAAQASQNLVFSNLTSHLHEQLANVGEGAEKDGGGGDSSGRLGGDTVLIDADSVHRNAGHQFRLSICPNTALESHCNFLSARADCCVYSGTALARNRSYTHIQTECVYAPDSHSAL